MICEICRHESTVTDFVSLRNLCEHLYLDAMVRKQESEQKVTGRKKGSSANLLNFA